MTTLSLTTIASLTTIVQSAAAQEVEECPPPESLEPLLALIDSLTTLAFLGGIGLGVLGFSIAAVMLMTPGEELNRRAKRLAKYTFFGVILLLAAPMIVDYLTSQLGEEAFC